MAQNTTSFFDTLSNALKEAIEIAKGNKKPERISTVEVITKPDPQDPKKEKKIYIHKL